MMKIQFKQAMEQRDGERSKGRAHCKARSRMISSGTDALDSDWLEIRYACILPP